MDLLMNRRLVGVVLVLSVLLLGVFARLAADPSSLIVDADHPSVDHARPRDDPAIGNDLTRLFLPHHLAIARSLAKLGRVPLWDDRGFGGRPLVGNPQAGLFYPPGWLVWWTGSASSLGWITVGHLLWMGLGTYRLGRTLGMGEWGSLVAAGCVQISPYVLAQTFEGHYPHVWAACWYPWAFDAAVRLRRGELLSGLMLAPILAATLLAGHPQEGYYLLITLGFWAVYDGMTAIRAGQVRGALRSWVLWAGLVILAVGMTGVELVPDSMAQEWTLRGTKLSHKLASRYHASPLNLLQLLSPRALGGPADYFGHENYWESVVSIGLIPLFLGAIGAAWSPDRRVARGWLILVVVSLLFAFGRKFGVFPLLFEVVPGMNRFRVPARSLFLASLGASMLAGLGVEALKSRAGLLEGWGRLARRASIFAALVAGLVLAGRFLTVTVSSDPSELDRLNLGLARLTIEPSFWLALGLVPVALVFGGKVVKARPMVAVILGLLGLGELGYHGHRLIVTSSASRYLDPDPISEVLIESRPPGLAPTRIRVVDAFYDDLRAGQFGLTKTNVNDSFQIQHAADLYEPLYRLFDAEMFIGDAPMDRAVGDYRAEIRQNVLDRMGVSLLVDDHLDPGASWPLISSGEWRGSTFATYRNPTALPRAYVVPRVELAADDRWLVTRFRQVDPREAVLMPVDPIRPTRTVRQPFTPAEWASTDPDRLVLRVETEAPGLLVVAETWMPGWSAQVDGKPTPIFRGNRSQRVVPLLEPGRHEVILTYQTPGLATGLALSTASTAVWIALAFASRSSLNTPSASGTDPGPRPRR
jgi:hypothetical protein